jgi:hypothetical protein
LGVEVKAIVRLREVAARTSIAPQALKRVCFNGTTEVVPFPNRLTGTHEGVA